MPSNINPTNVTFTITIKLIKTYKAIKKGKLTNNKPVTGGLRLLKTHAAQIYRETNTSRITRLANGKKTMQYNVVPSNLSTQGLLGNWCLN